MKKIYALFAVVLVSTTAFAKEPGDGSKSTGLAVVKRSESAFTLFYQPAGVTDVKVLIHDAEGKEVYSESVRKTDGFIRPYTLSDLSKGEYSISVIDGETELTEKFYNGSLVSKKSARIIKIDESRYLVAIPSTLYSGDARIKIYNDGELAHQQLVETGNGFGKIFNLKNLSGNLTFEVTDNAGNRIN
jgi:hypothetical protein